ncbi:hypothetical protein OPT61_g6361 [Boeremia exigua]|uniref:Uncharacterized protein n=1 Tax=Boeremia exigua TaxID=749465 RepID=A0ACC2I715_9PLEO|nr:hypothetical protein OPT61_g6361 [Boeremia exigua]
MKPQSESLTATAATGSDNSLQSRALALCLTLFFNANTIESEPYRPSLYVALRLSNTPDSIADKVLIYDASNWMPFEAQDGEAQDLDQAVRRVEGASSRSVNRDLTARVSTRGTFNQVVSTLELSMV